MGFIRITHPKTKGEAVVSERALTHLEPLGWKRADTKATPAPTPDAVPAAKTKEN